MKALYNWQIEALNQIKNQNAIVSAPTGAGKTKVAYEWANLKGAFQGQHKIIYTVPIKAIANEKYEELKNIFGRDSIGIHTGDVSENTKAPFLVTVQEIYTKKYKKLNIPMRIIIDEFHYIFQDKHRSRAYIDGLINPNRKHKFHIISATFGQPETIKSYLERISGLRFELYHTDWRPTELEYTKNIYTFENVPNNCLIYAFSKRLIDMIVQQLQYILPPLPLLKRRRIKKIADAMKVKLDKFPELLSGVAKYHSGLTYTEKKFIERIVREGYITRVVSTSALGVGINMPFEYVLFADTEIPEGYGVYRMLTKIEFVQFSGRAGRKGYFDKGFVGLYQHSFFNRSKGFTQVINQYLELLEKPLEKPVIELDFDIEKYLDARNLFEIKEKLEEEVIYLTKYSLTEDLKEFKDKVIQKATEHFDKFKELFENNIYNIFRQIYMPELSFEQNKDLSEKFAKVFREKETPYGKLDYDKKSKVHLLKFKVPKFREEEDVKALALQYRIAKKLDGQSIGKCIVFVVNKNSLKEKIKDLDPMLLLN